MSTSLRDPVSSPNRALKHPLILVLGATGTGKSNLAIALAQKFDAEIVNCDAMQMYEGLPIITNKLSVHEQKGIPHHLLGTIGLEEKPWTVADYARRASEVIGDVIARGKRAVLVGGTGYYAHGTLFRDGILGYGGWESDGKQGLGEDRRMPELDEMSIEELLSKLRELDPELAQRWHPKDRRKIQRSLEICLRTGKKASVLYRDQAKQRNRHAVPGVSEGIDPGVDSLRYDPLIFWLSAHDAPLKERLNARVDTMVGLGLHEEALQLLHVSMQYHEKGIPFDKSEGIWGSIGYKEMETWAISYLKDPLKSPKDGKLANACIEAVKSGTRQYAKRQDRYIRNRLATYLRETDVMDRLFILDTTDLARFEKDVVTPAHAITDAFLAARELPKPKELNDLARSTVEAMEVLSNRQEVYLARFCDDCNKTMMTQKEWDGHLASRSHKNCLAGKRKKAMLADQRRAQMAT
jgi:tRNA dimethylallyltransferase